MGSSGNPCDDTYRGKEPFSEPATRQIKNFLEKTEEGRSVKIALNFHSFGNMLLYPFAYIHKELNSEILLEQSNEEIMDMFQDTLCFTIQDH